MMTNHEWQANILLTAEIARESIEQNFPDLQVFCLKKLSEGWDNEVYLVNDRIIFRFPRRQVAVELIERENSVLKELESIGVVEIPKVLYKGMPTKQYPYAFHGYEMLTGTIGSHANLSNHDREASIATISTFLRKLHAVQYAPLKPLIDKPFVYDRTDIPQAIQTLSDRVSKIIALNIVRLNLNVFQSEVIAASQIQLPRNHCLIHGDLYSRHLLFNDNRLTGIIDWGDCGINSPSIDLAVIWSFYPERFHDQFFKIYGFVENSIWQYARFLGLYSCFTTLLYGHNIGDNQLVTESIAGLKRINPEILS